MKSDKTWRHKIYTGISCNFIILLHRKDIKGFLLPFKLTSKQTQIVPDPLKKQFPKEQARVCAVQSFHKVEQLKHEAQRHRSNH